MTSSPWIAILTQPRETIARIASKNPNQGLWWLAAIYGFSSVLNTLQTFLAGHHLHIVAIFLFALILCPFWGYISLSVWSWAIMMAGKLLRGAGNFQTIRCAYAWSCVPLVINIPLWILLALLFGSQLFTNFGDHQTLTNAQATILFCILMARIAAVIWSIVIYVNALAEVQSFTILRAIGNILAAGLFITLAIYFSLLLLSYFIHPAPQATSFLDNNLFQTLRYL